MTTCILCPTYNRTPTHVTTGTTCTPCHGRLTHHLQQIPALHARLPEALHPTSTTGQRVTGTPERSLGVPTAVLDLMLPAPTHPTDRVTDTRIPALGLVPYTTVVPDGWKPGREVTYLDRRPLTDTHGNPILVPAGDQTGHIPPAHALDAWVRYWAYQRGMGEQRPEPPTVPALAEWLADRVDWVLARPDAATRYDAPDLASEAKRMVGVLYAVVEPTADSRPTVYRLPCPDCRTLTLTQAHGDPYVACSACDRLWQPGDLLKEAS